MLEAGEPVFPNDARTRAASALLKQLTAIYVEDAPRISALTIRLVQDLRAANQAVLPSELLAGAIQGKRPSSSGRGYVLRRFGEFARLYRKLRIDEGKDHAAALAELPSTTSTAGPAPSPVPQPEPQP
jgi:hypothetical protein